MFRKTVLDQKDQKYFRQQIFSKKKFDKVFWPKMIDVNMIKKIFIL